MNVAIVLGTAREGRNSENVFSYLCQRFAQRDAVTVVPVDVRNHVVAPVTVPPWGSGGVDSTPTEWQQIVREADSLVFVLPEYNHGYPGEWKILIDSLYADYAGKDAFIVGVSDGSFAGVRVADHVKPILIELKLIVRRASLYVGNVDTLFRPDGTITDDAFSIRCEKFIDAVVKKQ